MLTPPNWVCSIAPSYSRKLQTPLGQRLLRGASWTIAGVMISRGMNLLAFLAVARILGVVKFGQLGIIQSTTGMFQVFAGCALGITATKYVAESRICDPPKAGRVIGLGVSVSLVTGLSAAVALFCSAQWLAVHALADSQLAPLLRISSGILLFAAVNGAQTGALAGFESFRMIAKVNLFNGLVCFPITLVAVLLNGVRGCVWGLVVSGAVSCILSQIALRTEMRRAEVLFSIQGVKGELAILARFTIPALLGGSVVVPVTWLCNVMLVNGSNGYGEMGILNAANQWYTAIVFFPVLLGQVLLPVLSERIGGKDTKSSAKLLKITIEVYALVSVPLVLLASAASPLIMRFYGRGYDDGWPTLIAVLCTAGFIAVLTPINQVIAATGRMWLGLLMNVVWGGICLVLTKYMIGWGALGLSLARLLAFMIYAVWAFAFAIRFLRDSRLASTADAPSSLPPPVTL